MTKFVTIWKMMMNRNRIKRQRLIALKWEYWAKQELKEEEEKKKKDVQKLIATLRQKNEQARQIIKNLLGLYFAPVVTNEDLKKQDEIIEQAKQFIKENE